MIGSGRGIVLGAAVLVATACGTGTHTTGSGSGGSTGSAPESLDVYCPKFVTAESTQLSNCFGGPLDIWTSVLNTTLPCSELADAVDAGRIAFSPAKAGDCIGALTKDTCADFLMSSDPQACVATLAGKVAAGGSCFADNDCSDTADFCSIAVGTCGGTCTAHLAMGTACDLGVNNECANGLYCDPQTLTCASTSSLPPLATLGGSCGLNLTTHAFLPCATGLVCNTAQQICMNPTKEGSGCYSGEGMCEQFTYCNGAGGCIAFPMDAGFPPFPDGGAPCAVAGMCERYPSTAGAFCGTVSGTDAVGCLGGLYCNTAIDGGNGANGVCAPLGGAGAPCNYGQECSSNRCSGSGATPGTCATPCTAL